MQLWLCEVIRNLPLLLKKERLLWETDEDVARKFIDSMLDKQMPEVSDLINEMNLLCDYKDVTFEMLNNAEFINLIIERFPDVNFEKLYSEEETIGKR
jgi:hypothetical protein